MDSLSISARLLDKFLKGLVPTLSDKLFDLLLVLLVLVYQWHHGQLSIHAFRETTAEALFPWVWALCGLVAKTLVKSAYELYCEIRDQSGGSITYVRLFDSTSPELVAAPSFYSTKILVTSISALCLLAWFCYWIWNASRDIPEAAIHTTASLSADKPHSTEKKTSHLQRYRQLHTTPCTMPVGTYYPRTELMPGGPDLKRPMFNLGGFYENAWYWKDDKYLMLFELTVTNRGEESTVRNWELCLIRDGKPLRFQVGEIPDEGITLPTSEKIKKQDSLTERLVREGVPHGRSVTGWVGFSVPKQLATEIIQAKRGPDGSLQFEDYLAHKYSTEFVGVTETPTSKVYVPGNN